jgi:protein involved in polysaccharide export with SLBB domain
LGLRLGTVLLVAATAACNAPRYKGTPIAEFLQLSAEDDAAAQASDDRSKPTTRPVMLPSEYCVGPADMLQVSIYGLESLDAPTLIPVRIGDTGSIVLPLVGTLLVNDYPISRLEKVIAAAYAPRYIKNPRVVVEVKEYQTTKVLVLSANEGAKEVPLRRNERSVFQALARAGSMHPSSRIVYVQPRMDVNRLEVFDLSRATDMLRAMSRPPLDEGDIVVTRPGPVPLVYVHGLAGGGGYPMPESGLRLRQAIAAAGGMPTDFDADKVALTRRLHDGRDVCVVLKWKNVIDGIEPDVDLRPGDVIEVPHTAETRIEDFIRKAVVFRFGVDAVFDPMNQYFPARVDVGNNDQDNQYSIRRMLLQDTVMRAGRTATTPLLGQ